MRAHPDLGGAIGEAEHAGHPPLAAAAAIPFVRTEILRPAALRAWRDRADATRRALADGAPLDLLVLGSGPSSAALVHALQRARPDLAIAVVDRAVPGGPFARAGAGFRLNTWSAPGPAGTSLVAEVDLHAGLAVSPAVMSAARFPGGDTLGDAALLTWVTTDCGAIIDEVTSIWLEADRVAFALAGSPGVGAGTAVIASGFGAEPRRSFDAAGNAFAAAEALRPIPARRVLDPEAVFAHAEAHGLVMFDGEDLAVVGAGPSALGVLALACGLGPAELTDAPGRFSRWRARPRLTWITGASGCASVRDLDDRAELGGMGYVIGQGAATLVRELAFLEHAGRLAVVPGRVETIAAAGERVRLVVGARAIEVARAILCTGYTPRLAELLRPPVASLADASEVVHDGGEPIALVLAGGRAHVIGAAVEEVIAPDESRPPFAESAMRAAALAARLAHSLPPGRAARAMWERAPEPDPRPRIAQPAARPWDRVLAPLDALLAVAPFELPPGPIAIAVSADGVRCTGLDGAMAARVEARIPGRLAACAARHGRIAIAIDVAEGRVVPASARESA